MATNKRSKEKNDVMDYAIAYWNELTEESKRIWRDRVMGFKPSLSDLENLWLRTDDPKWLEVEPPENFYFCSLMLDNLSEENAYRRLAIQVMEGMLPLKHYGGRTKFAILGALIDLYMLEKNNVVWNEIVRFLDEFRYAEFAYQKTKKREALEIALSFCNGGKKSPRMRKLLKECFPEDKPYVLSFLV